MIYTGNNGRIYIARQVTSGLTGTFTQKVANGVTVIKGQQFFVRNIVGGGTGGIVQAESSVAGDGTRSCVFAVISTGRNYEAGNVVRFSRRKDEGVQDVTDNVTIGAVKTTGIDSDREILKEEYRIAKIRSWSLTSNSEIVETTALGDVTKTYSPSVTSGEGSATLMFYEDAVKGRGGDNKQKDVFELVDLLFPRSSPPRVVLSLSVDGSASGTADIVGEGTLWKTNFLFNAYITSASVGVSYGEVVTVDTSFTVDGPLLDVPNKPGVVRL